jgi:uncharacterized membrane protein
MGADTQLFSWESLMTISGASLLVFLIVQYTKQPLRKILKYVPTDLYTAFVSFVILVTASLAEDSNTWYEWKMYVLCFFNSFLIASTSSHIYAKTKNPPVSRKAKEAKKEESATENTYTESIEDSSGS